MLIDWFTVIAQIINFLVLVALLKRFLYGRIIKAMDQREEKIAFRLADAERKRNEAEQEAQAYRKKNRSWMRSVRRCCLKLKGKSRASEKSS